AGDARWCGARWRSGVTATSGAPDGEPAGGHVAGTTGGPVAPVVGWQCAGAGRHDPSCRVLSPDRLAPRPSVIILATFPGAVNIGCVARTAPCRGSVLLEELDQPLQSVAD